MKSKRFFLLRLVCVQIEVEGNVSDGEEIVINGIENADIQYQKSVQIQI